MDRTRPQVHVAPVRCPFCHGGIPKGEAPAVCAECHALHHVACMDEHGACAACGHKGSSPEDSKVEAALRARASARLESTAPTESPPGAQRLESLQPATRTSPSFVPIWVVLSTITAIWGLTARADLFMVVLVACAVGALGLLTSGLVGLFREREK